MTRFSTKTFLLAAALAGILPPLTFEEAIDAILTTLAADLRYLVLHPERFGSSDPVAYGSFDARNIARRFADIFDQVVGEFVA